jgi:hypothetical protein
MDQSSQSSYLDSFFTPEPEPAPEPAPVTPLSLPPEATYPSKEALFEAIQAWAKLRGYAFTIAKSKRIKDRR